MTADSTKRQEIEELLPWHAAGTLGADDARRVEEALADDAELARHYALVREELAETVGLNESLGTPSTRAFDTLMASIDAAGARTRPSAGWLTSLFESLSPRTLAWSGAAAALVIVLQAGVIATMTMQEMPGTYQTASGPAAPGTPITRSLAAGTFVLIRFNGQASAGELTRFMTDNKLSIAEGPLANGMYRVKIADTVLSREEVTRTVRQLQNSKLVELIATQ